MTARVREVQEDVDLRERFPGVFPPPVPIPVSGGALRTFKEYRETRGQLWERAAGPVSPSWIARDLGDSVVDLDEEWPTRRASVWRRICEALGLHL